MYAAVGTSMGAVGGDDDQAVIDDLLFGGGAQDAWEQRRGSSNADGCSAVQAQLQMVAAAAAAREEREADLLDDIGILRLTLAKRVRKLELGKCPAEEVDGLRAQLHAMEAELAGLRELRAQLGDGESSNPMGGAGHRMTDMAGMGGMGGTGGMGNTAGGYQNAGESKAANNLLGAGAGAGTGAARQHRDRLALGATTDAQAAAMFLDVEPFMDAVANDDELQDARNMEDAGFGQMLFKSSSDRRLKLEAEAKAAKTALEAVQQSSARKVADAEAAKFALAESARLESGGGSSSSAPRPPTKQKQPQKEKAKKGGFFSNLFGGGSKKQNSNKNSGGGGGAGAGGSKVGDAGETKGDEGNILRVASRARVSSAKFDDAGGAGGAGGGAGVAGGEKPSAPQMWEQPSPDSSDPTPTEYRLQSDSTEKINPLAGIESSSKHDEDYDKATIPHGQVVGVLEEAKVVGVVSSHRGMEHFEVEEGERMYGGDYPGAGGSGEKAGGIMGCFRNMSVSKKVLFFFLALILGGLCLAVGILGNPAMLPVWIPVLWMDEWHNADVLSLRFRAMFVPGLTVTYFGNEGAPQNGGQTSGLNLPGLPDGIPSTASAGGGGTLRRLEGQSNSSGSISGTGGTSSGGTVSDGRASFTGCTASWTVKGVSLPAAEWMESGRGTSDEDVVDEIAYECLAVAQNLCPDDVPASIDRYATTAGSTAPEVYDLNDGVGRSRPTWAQLQSETYKAFAPRPYSGKVLTCMKSVRDVIRKEAQKKKDAVLKAKSEKKKSTAAAGTGGGRRRMMRHGRMGRRLNTDKGAASSVSPTSPSKTSATASPNKADTKSTQDKPDNSAKTTKTTKTTNPTNPKGSPSPSSSPSSSSSPSRSGSSTNTGTSTPVTSKANETKQAPPQDQTTGTTGTDGTDGSDGPDVLPKSPSRPLEKCDAGEYLSKNTSTGGYQCELCPAGTYSGKGAGVCAKCAAGKTTATVGTLKDAADETLSCKSLSKIKEETTNDANSKDVDKCFSDVCLNTRAVLKCFTVGQGCSPKGVRQWTGAFTQCTEDLKTTTGAVINAKWCAPCFASSACGQKIARVASTTKCNAGEYLSPNNGGVDARAGGGGCELCPAGTYSGKGATACATCKAGKTTATVGTLIDAADETSTCTTPDKIKEDMTEDADNKDVNKCDKDVCLKSRAILECFTAGAGCTAGVRQWTGAFARCAVDLKTTAGAVINAAKCAPCFASSECGKKIAECCLDKRRAECYACVKGVSEAEVCKENDYKLTGCKPPLTPTKCDKFKVVVLKASSILQPSDRSLKCPAVPQTARRCDAFKPELGYQYAKGCEPTVEFKSDGAACCPIGCTFRTLDRKVCTPTKPADDTPYCCSAATASCIACQTGKTVDDICAFRPTTVGCDTCCKAKTAVCLACQTGKTVDDICGFRPTTAGCNLPGDGCCTDQTQVKCLACHSGMGVKEFCKSKLYKNEVGCPVVGPGDEPFKPGGGEEGDTDRFGVTCTQKRVKGICLDTSDGANCVWDGKKCFFDAAGGPVNPLPNPPPGPTKPVRKKCCGGKNAKCQSCSADVTVEEFCVLKPTVAGCAAVSPPADKEAKVVAASKETLTDVIDWVEEKLGLDPWLASPFALDDYAPPATDTSRAADPARRPESAAHTVVGSLLFAAIATPDDFTLAMQAGLKATLAKLSGVSVDKISLVITAARRRQRGQRRQRRRLSSGSGVNVVYTVQDDSKAAAEQDGGALAAVAAGGDTAMLSFVKDLKENTPDGGFAAVDAITIAAPVVENQKAAAGGDDPDAAAAKPVDTKSMAGGVRESFTRTQIRLAQLRYVTPLFTKIMKADVPAEFGDHIGCGCALMRHQKWYVPLV